MIALASWSVALSNIWGLGMGTALAFNALGLAVGCRFLAKKGVKADQRSYYLYNVSYTCSFSLSSG